MYVYLFELKVVKFGSEIQIWNLLLVCSCGAPISYQLSFNYSLLFVFLKLQPPPFVLSIWWCHNCMISVVYALWASFLLYIYIYIKLQSLLILTIGAKILHNPSGYWTTWFTLYHWFDLIVVSEVAFSQKIELKRFLFNFNFYTG